ncbi:prenyltransferase/squalene oxidase repeat-containing protein [Rhodopirellula sp. P2]|uniref:prenyltransferase/squalene oxidase repeat-containing protein n=1 Tax=Rhodopirellula sp. P2 TaxID=2127060 RepID=UPI0023682518|nr:prenyltransferase/squalene oxidase repeat-containing protein [Rhodopirellula sp. P2]WDQ16088.1 prenyltransferase/squalene oxidase repeat-containing protein [Rhodopirellula sp. P2]
MPTVSSPPMIPVADASDAPPIASWDNLETLWADPNIVRVVALIAVTFLVITIVLFRRRKASGRGAAIVCLILSVVLHGVLILYVPKLSVFWSGGGPASDSAANAGAADIAVSMFDPEMLETLQDSAETLAQPSPLAALKLPEPLIPEREIEADSSEPLAADEVAPEPESDPTPTPTEIPLPSMPAVLASAALPTQPAPTESSETVPADVLDSSIDDWLQTALADPIAEPDQESTQPSSPEMAAPPSEAGESNTIRSTETEAIAQIASVRPAASLPEERSAGTIDEDFASRTGAAKAHALIQNGGDADTEAAVEAALKYLASQQRSDGAWDPKTTGAGQERAPLGLHRGGAGRNAETAITGLALLSMLGSGHTHQEGEHRDTVYRGLAFLLSRQRADGSLASNASVYAAHYSHAMAGLALAETAAMTADPSAMEAARRAVAYTRSMQHPVTGGWRYNRGDAGDLSQLGWQALLIDSADRSGAAPLNRRMSDGIARFLDSVRRGRAGGQACYRPGEPTSPTMTAEALATRLLIGQKLPDATIREAESVLLTNLPGQGTDNYYYWYYATMALHQLQDDAWETWNAALKQRLLSTQLPDGSWSDQSLWGGYGGTVYTTAMATLCLESYYRHSRRPE